MDIHVVRSSDPACVPSRCGDWLALDGPIGPGSAAKFSRVLHALGRRRLPVLVNSPGGLVNEAMAIGTLIRERHLDVAVTRTSLVTCPADRDACRKMTPDGLVLGLPESRRAFCASACPLILAAGTRRFVAPWARVGVHQYVGFAKKMKVMRTFRIVTRAVNGVRVEVSRTLVSEHPLPDTAVLVRERPHYGDSASYFLRMGIGAGIMPLLQLAPSTGIYWLTPDNLLATRLATDTTGGEDLVMPAPVSPAPPGLPPTSLPAPGPAAPAAPDQPEIAALIDDSGTAIHAYSGHATWFVDHVAGEAGDPVGTDLVATVALDNDAGALSLRIDRREDMPGHFTTRLSVRLLHGRNSPIHGIVALQTPDVRADAHALPDALVGRVEDAPPAVFSMLLSDTVQDQDRDMALLSAAQWIDVPLAIDGAKTVKITFALGTSGRRAVRQWQVAPRSTPRGDAPRRPAARRAALPSSSIPKRGFLL